jgi:hypothetical protein
VPQSKLGLGLAVFLLVSRFDDHVAYYNADLVTHLGGETDFSLRAYSERGGFRSLDYDEITVRKV